jgi:hypothetical protein
MVAPFVELKGADFPVLANGAKAAVSQPVQNSGLCRQAVGLNVPPHDASVIDAA